MITQAEVLKRYIYHADGYLTFREAAQGRQKGSRVGCLNGNGYVCTDIKAKLYSVHRLIFLYHHGYMPTQTDHINGIRVDNRISNLRDVSVSENNRNQKIPRNNTSGHIGVYWNKKLKKWYSQIWVNDKKIHLGYFKDFDGAVVTRKQPEKKYGFHENHGRKG